MTWNTGNWREPGAGVGWHGSSHSGQQSNQATSQQPPSPSLGPLLKTFNDSDLEDALALNKEDASITDCEDVASFNWMNEEEPTIVVPGKPPLWTPLRSATRLKPDDGEYFRDQNAARSPEYPMEPAIRAILASQPDFEGIAVDLVACSSTLNYLLRYTKKEEKTFRILVEIVGDTVFFVRRENSPTELIPGVTGFGHSFPETYTTWEAEVKKSESHQRILRYDFGGLDLLVRFEADGYLNKLIPARYKDRTATQCPGDPDLDDSFSSALQVSMKQQLRSGKQLTISHGGESVPQRAIFDLKTRSFRKRDQDTLAETLPRLWVAQIPNFILAYHQAGLFDDVRVQDVRQEIDDWEIENQETLCLFGALLRKIVALARSNKDTKLELRRLDQGGLELRKQADDTAMGTLPDALKERWISGPSGGSEKSINDSDEPQGQGHYRSFRETFSSDDEDDVGEKDFTACSAEDCGYCGHCDH
ncbi:MAG: hypothetical protein Q9220_001487 [cf. Caloplaca sp. 1 TL-2023]